MKSVTISHDDNDGDYSQSLTVAQANDGDMHLMISINSMRYRTMIGGGIYPRTYFALRNLLEAMEQDQLDLESGQFTLTNWTDAAAEFEKLQSKLKSC